MMEILMSVLRGLWSIVAAVARFVVRVLKWVLFTVFRAMSGGFALLKKLAGRLWELCGQIPVKRIFKSLYSFVAGAGRCVVRALKWTLFAVIHAVSGVFSLLKKLLGKLWELFRKIPFKKIFKCLVSLLTTFLTAAVPMAGYYLMSIITLMNSVISGTTVLLWTLAVYLWNRDPSRWETVSQKLPPVVVHIVEWMIKAWDSLARRFSPSVVRIAEQVIIGVVTAVILNMIGV